MKQIALVTGAGGSIGSTLVHRLLERGYAVRALVREGAPSLLSENAEVIRGDITDYRLMRDVASGVDVAFHLAAKLHVNSPAPELKGEYERVNVEGTRTLAQAMNDAGARRLVFFSTINVYGATRAGQIMDETSPLNPDSWYAETKARAEEIVSLATPSVILRVAAVYGPNMKGNFPRLLHALKKRRPVLVVDGSNRRTLVYIEDLCRASILAAEHPLAEGQTYNVTDGAVHTLREIINAMSDALKRPRPKFSLPKSTVRFAAGMLEDCLRVLGKSSPVGRSTVDKLTEDVAASGEKIQQQLGFQPQYDLQAGWRETISLAN
ncbi:MAG: NAD-dependent epimerase/dehydratase family protein [Pyrinomonadaceae bacterium]|nr:NAD-dependent epimerase/dehydratase family protein [Pyrinomonadaceae bacterium]